MKDDSSMEFDMFEDARRRLTRVFESQGHDPLEAERAALYVVQGVREVPRLIALLTHGERPDETILVALDKVFVNAPALARAHAVLAGLDDPPLH
jgi:hypothetical protein